MHPFNEILSGHEKEWSVCYNRDEPWWYAKWKKATYLRTPLHETSRLSKFIEREKRHFLGKGGLREKGEWFWWVQISFRGEKILHNFSGDDCIALWLYYKPLNCTH